MVKHSNRLRLSKKVKRSGANVVKLFRGGGCTAPDIVSQYISPPNSNIPAGYDGVQSIFQRVFYTPGLAQTNLITSPTQLGGGYMIDPAQTIDKVAIVQPYPPRAEPVILDGKVFLSQGCESQCGAGKISSYNVKKMTQRKSKSKSQVRKMSQRKSKSRSSRSNSRRSQRKVVARKVNKNSRRNRRKQRGGNEGEPGNFSPDMMTRDFEGKQPSWGVNTI
jgi:hypothetical protein